MSAPGEPLTDLDWRGAAWMLDCDVPAVKAVARVEAPNGGYLPGSAPLEPVILFERHIFHRRTNGRHAGARAPGLAEAYSLLSSPTPGGYGPSSKQHQRLRAATALDRVAALESASWGRFQVMGFNWASAGYASLQDFLNGMILGGEDEHLRAMVAYVRSRPGLAAALREHRWPVFAELYNGKDYWRHKYDVRLAAAWVAEGGIA